MSNLHTNGTPDKVTPADYGKLHAFPYIVQVPNPLNPREIRVHVNQGVTIRDYFAAHALATCSDVGNIDTATGIADWCYRVADAMLSRREEKPSQFHEDYMESPDPSVSLIRERLSRYATYKKNGGLLSYTQWVADGADLEGEHHVK